MDSFTMLIGGVIQFIILLFVLSSLAQTRKNTKAISQQLEQTNIILRDILKK